MIFADTVYFFALLSSHDQWHETAHHLTMTLEEPVLTSAWVLVETGNGLAATARRKTFSAFVAQLEKADNFEIVPATMDWFHRGLDLYARRPDKEWSLTDCISFALMKERGLSAALTNDHLFEQAGFRVLMKAT